MAIDAKADNAAFKKKIAEYDYIRFSVSDINGVCRGKVVPGHFAHRFLQGIGIYGGVIGFSAQDEIPMKTMREITSKGHPNVTLVPDTSTFHDIPWAASGQYKVGEMFGCVYWDEAKMRPFASCPRNVAMDQLNKLDKMGYSLYSGYEIECNLYDNKSGDPIVDGISYCSNTAMSKFDDLIFGFDQALRKAGVLVESISTEYNPGQFEFALHPEPGIKSTDSGFLTKIGLKEMANKGGFIANFMGKPYYIGCGSGTHFNFSVWSKDTGVNVFYDPSRKDQLSEFAMHWLGGLMKHTASLVALSAPSTNCYRRYHQAFAPHKNYWGFQDRTAAFRMKVGGPDDSYIENRLPSAAANFYLILAATVAAGMEGVLNKIEPPPPGVSEETEDVPYTQQEALKALKADKIITEALGEEFIEWYIGMKEEIDLSLIGGHDVKTVKEAELEVERRRYEDKI